MAAYQLLQVAPWARTDEVNRAYRALAMRHHPDLHQQDPVRGERMVRLNDARTLLVAR